MSKTLATILLVAGLAIIGYGLVEKDDKQTHVDLGVAELELGKKDSVFTPYFIIGGIAAIAGIVLLVNGRKV
jgi:hypothetical protein